MAKAKKLKKVAKKRLPSALLPFQLIELVLVKSSASREGVKGGVPPPGHVTVNTQLHVGVNEEAHALGALFEIAVLARYKAEEEPALQIYGQFKLGYKFTKSIANVDHTLVTRFMMKIGGVHVWPYWRDLVQTTTLKMGMPALRMPLTFEMDSDAPIEKAPPGKTF
jgi:hypothetical protein